MLSCIKNKWGQSIPTITLAVIDNPVPCGTPELKNCTQIEARPGSKNRTCLYLMMDQLYDS